MRFIKTTLLAFCLLLYPSLGSAFSLVSQNLNRLFDDRDDGNGEKILPSHKYQYRIAAVAKRIAKPWQQPDVIAFQEVENRRVLSDISTLLQQKTGTEYRPVLIEGHDVSGIDVGFLVKSNYHIKRIEALFYDTRWRHKQSRVFSRPPLRIDICHQSCLTIINVHLRSMRGISKGKRATYVRQKRLQQAQMLARWIEQFQQAQPHRGLMIVGDFNALTPSDRYVDVLGTLLGKPDQTRPLLKSADLIQRDLIDASAALPKSRRVSYRYRRRNQQLDYLLISQPLAKHIRHIGFGKIDYRFSDHASLQASFELLP